MRRGRTRRILCLIGFGVSTTLLGATIFVWRATLDTMWGMQVELPPTSKSNELNFILSDSVLHSFFALNNKRGPAQAIPAASDTTNRA
ncbi:MAG: hypothetical protein H7Y88_03775 [Phycisphaerales bacterium]|nr:hypothetical protein [Phycisphaerales bacterium]